MSVRGPSGLVCLLPAVALGEVLTAALAAIGLVGLVGGVSAAVLARVRRRERERG